MNAEDKEKWVDEVMASLDGLGKPAYNPALYYKVMKEVSKKSTQTSVVVFRRLALAASLLLVVNIFSVVKYANRSVATSQSTPIETQSIATQLSDFNSSGF